LLKLAKDQAEGLRRLLGKEGLRVIRLNSARRGIGKTACAVNLAAALAEMGRDVLILDEAGGARNACDQLGLRPRADFGQVIRGECRIEQAISVGNGVAVLPLGDGLKGLESLDDERRRRLVAHVEQADLRCDTVIIDAAPGESSRLFHVAPGGIEDMLLLGASGSALTDAYAWLKSATARFGPRRQHILFNRVRDESQARALFGNFAGAAQRYLGSELALFGVLPADESLKRAGELAVPAVHAFPAAAAAIGLRQLALRASEFPRGRQQMSHLGDLFHALARPAEPLANPTQSRGARHPAPSKTPFGLAAAMAG
jgi:flagellar biosynthesis protein FlhG